MLANLWKHITTFIQRNSFKTTTCSILLSQNFHNQFQIKLKLHCLLHYAIFNMLAYMQSIVEMYIHLLKCAYNNEQIQIHNVVRHAFVFKASKVDFHVVHEQLHMLPSSTYKSLCPFFLPSLSLKSRFAPL